MSLNFKVVRDKINNLDKIIVNKKNSSPKNYKKCLFSTNNSSNPIYKTEQISSNHKSRLNTSYLEDKTFRKSAKNNDSEYLLRNKVNKSYRETSDSIKDLPSKFYNSDYSRIPKNYQTKSYYVSSKTEKNNLYKDHSFDTRERNNSSQSNTSYGRSFVDNKTFIQKKRIDVLKSIVKSLTPYSKKSEKCNKTQENIYINPKGVKIEQPDFSNSKKNKSKHKQLKKFRKNAENSPENQNLDKSEVGLVKIDKSFEKSDRKLASTQKNFNVDKKEIPRISNIYKNMIFCNKKVPPSKTNKHNIKKELKSIMNQSQFLINSVLYEKSKICSRDSQRSSHIEID